METGFSQKHASGMFALILGVIVVMSFVVVIVVESANLDINNFWVGAGFGFVQYMLFFAVFVFLCIKSGVLNKQNNSHLFHQLWLRAHSIHHENRIVVKKSGKRIFSKDVLVLLLLTAICLVGFILFTGLIVDLFIYFGYTQPSVAPELNSFAKYLTAIVVMAVMPAIIEELIFRGVILRGFLKYGTVAAVIISSVLFSLFHLSPAQTVYQLVLGIVLALVVLKTGKLMYAIIIHFINNFLIITYIYVFGDLHVAMNWGVGTVLLAIGLAVVSCVAIYETIKVLGATSSNIEKEGVCTITNKREKFFSLDNIGLFMCVMVAGLIWIVAFIG